MATRFELVIGSDIRDIREVIDRIDAAMQAEGCSAEEILDTQHAVEEAMVNVIVHGYGKPGEPIVVSGDISDARVEIRIADTAPPFDPLSVPPPERETTLEDRKPGGLGVFLIRQLMDDVGYRYENGWNILTLSKERR